MNSQKISMRRNGRYIRPKVAASSEVDRCTEARVLGAVEKSMR